MDDQLRERLGKLAATLYWGEKYSDWNTMPEAIRERWRDTVEAVVEAVAPIVVKEREEQHGQLTDTQPL